MSSNANEGLLDRHHFLLRRLHSLSGLVPIGAFLLPHLTTNSSIMWGSWLGRSHLAQGGHPGVETFQHEVNFIHSLPALVLIEIFVLWLPIAFHAALGVYFGISGQPNVKAYRYSNNWRYVLQRVSGYLGVIFIFMHISSLRWGWGWFGLFPTGFEGTFAASTTAAHFQDGSALRTFVVSAFYLICVLGLVYHFANGLWTAAITWGLTITEGAQRRWGYVCTVVGFGLGAASIMAVIGFNTVDVTQAKAIELQLVAPATHVEDGTVREALGGESNDTATEIIKHGGG